MKKFHLISYLLVAISINTIASELKCQFVDGNPEAVQLICDPLDDSPNDNCSATFFGENSQKNDTLKVRSMKVGLMCPSIIASDWTAFSTNFLNIGELDNSFTKFKWEKNSIHSLTC